MKNAALRIQYLEKPATRDEKKIGSLLERLTQAVESGDDVALGVLLADDATIIESDEYPAVDKETYVSQAAERMRSIRRLYYTDVIIRVMSDEAKISGVRNVLFRNAPSAVSRRRLLTCRKKDGQWLIWSAKSI